MYDYARTIEINSKASDKLADIVVQRFNEAVRWQMSERVGDDNLRGILKNCYDQYSGILSCEDQEVADALGVDPKVNLTAMKGGVVQAFLAESLIQGASLPWTIQPTPIPDLSASGRLAVLDQLKAELYGNQFDGDLSQLIKSLKSTQMRVEFESAQKSASAMEKLITDQCIQGGWDRAMYGFINDFVYYPYAVLQGPVPVRRVALNWTGDSARPKYETVYEFKNVSPWDFWYSPDSPDTQRGTGVFVRQRWTRRDLLNAAKLSSYRYDAIKEVLTEANNQDFPLQWMSENPDQPGRQLALWINCSATIDVLIHYGFFSGRELRGYGVSGVEDLEYYNATVTVIQGRTIQVVVSANPHLNTRPIYTTSFYKTRDRIPNYGIAQRMRDVERCYMSSLRYLMSNAYSASGPITEADYSRLAKFMSDDDVGRVVPNMVYYVDSEMGVGNPAMRFTNIPSNIPAYAQLLQYFMDLCDRVTNIPAALHGTAVGSGVNRTFRGASMLQGNAVKSIQSAVTNIDQFVFAPLGELIYNYNMQYETDPSIKGDCKIIAQGAKGLLQREIDRQNSYELLQIIASAGSQMAQTPKGLKIADYAFNTVLKNMGVPDDLISGGDNQPIMAAPTNPENNGAEVPSTGEQI